MGHTATRAPEEHTTPVARGPVAQAVVQGLIPPVERPVVPPSVLATRLQEPLARHRAAQARTPRVAHQAAIRVRRGRIPGLQQEDATAAARGRTPAQERAAVPQSVRVTCLRGTLARHRAVRAHFRPEELRGATIVPRGRIRALLPVVVPQSRQATQPLV